MINSGPLLLTGASGWFGRTALHVYERDHGSEGIASLALALGQVQGVSSPEGGVSQVQTHGQCCQGIQ